MILLQTLGANPASQATGKIQHAAPKMTSRRRLMDNAAGFGYPASSEGGLQSPGRINAYQSYFQSLFGQVSGIGGAQSGLANTAGAEKHYQPGTGHGFRVGRIGVAALPGARRGVAF